MMFDKIISTVILTKSAKKFIIYLKVTLLFCCQHILMMFDEITSTVYYQTLKTLGPKLYQVVFQIYIISLGFVVCTSAIVSVHEGLDM